MILIWDESAWEDYLYWQQTNKKILKRINALIKDITRQPFTGIGDPEPLKYNWTGYWARRIDQEHRLIYKVTDDSVLIAQCRYHYTNN
jgi:toxin YoeB